MSKHRLSQQTLAIKVLWLPTYLGISHFTGYDILLILQYQVSTTVIDGLGRCFRFVCIYACAAVFLCCYRFSVNKDLYIAFYFGAPCVPSWGWHGCGKGGTNSPNRGRTLLLLSSGAENPRYPTDRYTSLNCCRRARVVNGLAPL